MRSNDIRSWLADPDRPGSLAAAARSKRWEMFLRAFPETESMEILDIGGTAHYWQSAPVEPARVTVLNLWGDEAAGSPRLRVVRGDACEPPPEVASATFDLVYSNSTIEHVGGHTRRRQFADVVRGLAGHHWVQTPYRYFPLEPHVGFPLFQHLPLRVRVAVAARWPLTPTGFPTGPEEIRDQLMDIELLSRLELAAYFPESRIELERVAGLVKSLIAVR